MELFIDALIEYYSSSQIHSGLTVGELIEFLKNFDDDAKIRISDGNLHTYGYMRAIRATLSDDEEN